MRPAEQIKNASPCTVNKRVRPLSWNGEYPATFKWRLAPSQQRREIRTHRGNKIGCGGKIRCTSTGCYTSRVSVLWRIPLYQGPVNTEVCITIRIYGSPWKNAERNGGQIMYRQETKFHARRISLSPLGPCACLASERIPPEGLGVRGVNVLQRSGSPASGLHAVHFI